MYRCFRFSVALWAAICLAGCTSMQAIRSPTPQTVRAKVKAGDEIEVDRKGGAHYELVVVSVDEQSLSGRSKGGPVVQIPLADIESLEVREFSAAKTGGTSAAEVAVLVVVGLVLVGLGGRAIAKGLDDKNDND